MGTVYQYSRYGLVWYFFNGHTFFRAVPVDFLWASSPKGLMKIARFQGWDSQIDTKYHSDSQFYDSRIDFILYTYVTYVYSVYQIHQRCRWLSSNFQVQELTHRVKSGKVRRVNWDAWHRFFFCLTCHLGIGRFLLRSIFWDLPKGTCPRRSWLVIQREVLLGLLSQAKNRAQVDIWFRETFADKEMRPESGLRRPSNCEP